MSVAHHVGAVGEGPDDYGTIGRFLRSPTQSVDLDSFCARLHARRITVRLAGLAAAALDLALIGRLRGALGEVLLRTASPQAAAGRPCPWTPPSAFEVLFRKQGRMTPGTDFPAPWVIAIQPTRDDLDVALTLFGTAVEWAPAAAEALVEVVRDRIDWRAAVEVFIPAPAIVSRRAAALALEDVPLAGSIGLDFLSPLAVTSKDPARDPAAAFVALGLRLEGLARWHGLTLAGVDWRALGGDLRRAEWEWSEVEAAQWRRGSRRQDRWVAMNGVRGYLHVSGDADVMTRISPLIRLGAATHVGADIAFGCGRYRIMPTAT